MTGYGAKSRCPLCSYCVPGVDNCQDGLDGSSTGTEMARTTQRMGQFCPAESAACSTTAEGDCGHHTLTTAEGECGHNTFSARMVSSPKSEIEAVRGPGLALDFSHSPGSGNTSHMLTGPLADSCRPPRPLISLPPLATYNPPSPTHARRGSLASFLLRGQTWPEISVSGDLCGPCHPLNCARKLCLSALRRGLLTPLPPPAPPHASLLTHAH